MDVNTTLQGGANQIFSCDHVIADKSQAFGKNFQNFHEMLERAQNFDLRLDFDVAPKAPAYPAECADFFSDKSIRVGYDFATSTITNIDVLEVNLNDVQYFYPKSAELQRKHGGIKIFSADLMHELRRGQSIYIFWSFGYLRACKQSEVKAFMAYSAEVAEYQAKAKAFNELVENTIQHEYTAARDTQSKQINDVLGVPWKGVYIVQSRLLHDKNFFGSHKKNTVAHVRLLKDFQKGRIKRTEGQLLCGSKAKFSLSNDMSDTKDYIVTCIQCLKIMGMQS